LGDLKKQILKKKNGHLVEKRELVAIMNKLQKMTLQERIDKLGLRPDRADVIMPAMALVLGVLEETKARAVSIPRTGLREGVLWDLRARSAVSVGLSERQVRSYAVELGRRYSFDEQHAKHATRLALLIFDQTRKLHRLVPEARLLLELAGLLHDVGHVINSDDHHKHSAYIIRESHFVGLTDRQRLIVSLVARYHRGGDPKSRDEHWRNVAKTDQRMVRILAGIVRLVEELDREHTQRVSRVKLRRRGKKLFLSLSAKNRLIVERVGAKARKGLLEKALGVSIVVA
jgi:exopolyphosphatase/guanosine-5'-triphosphate,3'-diphosphate pyrophosphatase